MSLTVIALGVCLIAADPPQTPAQMEAEMQRADEMPIATAPVEYRTPRKTFQTYWDAVKRIDSSEFACLTQACITQMLQKDEPLTPERLQRMSAGRSQMMERNHQLVSFKYVGDAQKPKIEFVFSEDRTVAGQVYHFKFLERVSLIRTTDGWKIDSSDQEETD